MGKCFLNNDIDEFLFYLHGRLSKKFSESVLKKRDRTVTGLLLPRCITHMNNAGEGASFHPLLNSFNRVVASGGKTPPFLLLAAVS